MSLKYKVEIWCNSCGSVINETSYDKDNIDSMLQKVQEEFNKRKWTLAEDGEHFCQGCSYTRAHSYP